MCHSQIDGVRLSEADPAHALLVVEHAVVISADLRSFRIFRAPVLDALRLKFLYFLVPATVRGPVRAIEDQP